MRIVRENRRTQRFGVADSARGVLDLPPRTVCCPTRSPCHLALLCNTFASLAF